jgi:Lipopolysaccharide kinase (Kdo/WaaP) family
MPDRSRDRFHVTATYQPILRELGLDAEAVFSDPRIVAWRSIRERENCTLDADLVDGRHVRWHVKRHRPTGGRVSPADEEARGIQLLESHGIATAPLVGWGRLADGRSFLISEDLSGFKAADKMVEAGLRFESILEPTARLAATLHAKGLHHRDLYLCHFFARVAASDASDGPVELRLIDAARVKPLPRWFSRRWVVKDLAQFWYSTRQLNVTDEQRARWLERYAGARGLASGAALRAAVERKASWIARHDRRLRGRQPGRNVSLPESGVGEGDSS